MAAVKALLTAYKASRDLSAFVDGLIAELGASSSSGSSSSSHLLAGFAAFMPSKDREWFSRLVAALPQQQPAAAATVRQPDGSSRGLSPGVGDTCVPSSPHAMLEKVGEKEKEIRREMRQLGAGNYSQLYSTQLLHKAAASPGLVAACLACDADTRRSNWVESVRQLALLLPKYDYAFPCSTPGDRSVTNTVGNSVSNSSSKGSTAKQKVDSLVDEATTRVLVCGLLHPPPVVLHDLMVNLERGEVEMYPANYWRNVAAGLHLTTDQKHTLQFSWQKVKATKAAHQALSARLTQLQQQFTAGFAAFEARAQQAMQDNKLEDVQQVSSPEQRQLEVQLDATRQLIKLQHYCQVLQLVNTLSRRQLATLYVLAFPYMPDAFMLCEELEAEAAAVDVAAAAKQ
ncbi:hypothetical protein OEZ86_014080 [Tetradesmus obliquus]|nr:hypothetical protein OEZ86_014080 [Tetradesmus obliquus]